MTDSEDKPEDEWDEPRVGYRYCYKEHNFKDESKDEE